MSNSERMVRAAARGARRRDLQRVAIKQGNVWVFRRTPSKPPARGTIADLATWRVPYAV